MKKYENFCAAFENLKEIYNYDEPYNTVVLTGLVGCMRFALNNHGR